MPDFKVTHINTLIRMAAEQSESALSYTGMRPLATALNDKQSLDSSFWTEKYLFERVFKPSQEALDREEATIALSTGRVNRLAEYVGFQHYEHYLSAWRKLENLLAPLTETSELPEQPTCFFYLIADEATATFYQEYKLRALFEGQAVPASWLSYPTGDHAAMGKKMEQALKQSVLSLLIVPEEALAADAFHEQIAAFAERQERIILFCTEWTGQVARGALPLSPDERLLTEEVEMILLIRLLTHIGANFEPGRAADKAPAQAQTIIQDSGAVFLGKNTRIKGKYLASRDMVFHVDKRKN